MLKSRTESAALQNGLGAAVFCYTSAHGTPLLFNMLWLEHLIHGDGTCPLGWCCTARILLGQKSREETEPINLETLLESIRTKIIRRILGMWAVFISASTHWLCQSRHLHLTTHRMGSRDTISQSPKSFTCNKTKTERSQRLHTHLPHPHPCLAYFAPVFSRARKYGK